ncbi:Trm112 family protein [Maritalea sp.]|jgi:uncharacterized protein YbaR (Trm112 family)|uniref:Trm112 family protein n=1 Tax=Maritalea sp. TaxID=2003361 RepID=UPI0039E53383
MTTKEHNIDPKMLEILVCPFTKTRLEWSKDKTELISYAARLAFPIRNNVPLLILDEARQLTDEEQRNPHQK